MIQRINYIKNMGIYRDFSWACEKNDDFKKVNILYGRNYSGKTTLSRVMRSLELRKKHKNYPDSEFKLDFSSGKCVSDRDIEQNDCPIRVFNSDFIVENLSFLATPSGDEGDIKPFAILGAQNIEIQGRIEGIKRELGRLPNEGKSGLDGKLKGIVNAIGKLSEKRDAVNEHVDFLVSDRATNRLTGIKYQSRKFGDQNYTKAKLYKHIEYVIAEKLEPLSDAETTSLLSAIDESPKPQPLPLYTFSPLLREIRQSVAELLERKIETSEKIQALSLDYALEQWVRSGIERHKDSTGVCLFCGSRISDGRWDELSRHFDRASETLKSDIENIENKIANHKIEFERAYTVDKNNFYSLHSHCVSELLLLIEQVRNKYIRLLDYMCNVLRRKRENIMQRYVFEDDDSIDALATEAAGKYYSLMKDTEEYTNTITNKIKEAQERLLYNEVLLFTREINYLSYKDQIDKFTNIIKVKDEEKRKTEADIKSLEDELKSLETQHSSESTAAELVNKYLCLYACDNLRLEVINGETTTEEAKCFFGVMRGASHARNLSDGERSLIAFCYFLAKLEENKETNIKPIVWIDDPISSLDGDHIFMTYSLLRSELVESGKVEQLFITTHNLEFFKYITRLIKSPNLYLISRTCSNAKITCLPDYMEKHVTEFNYLFKQIYMCAYSELGNVTENVYYDFGNNARKFLELYLFYKYPDHNMSQDDKMTKFFGNEVTAYFINRVDNERSHLLATFERARLLVDIPELKNVARLIIEAIKNKDNEQYEAFLSSVGLDVHAHAAEIEQE